MDAIDRRILDEMQEAFPLVEKPFEAIASRTGLTEDQILGRVRRLQADGIVRQIGAIFDSARLGYRGALLAFRVDESRVEEAAAIAGAHPGVSHNYLRNHAYNLWLTLTVPPESDLRGQAEELARRAGATKWLFLPSLRVFKIGVRFRMGEVPRASPPVEKEKSEDIPASPFEGEQIQSVPSPEDAPGPRPARQEERRLDERAIRAVRALQKPLSVEPEPFGAQAMEAGVSAAELLGIARGFLEAGIMRRFAATLHHRQAGYSHNVLTAWEVAPERVAEVGRILSGFDEVSHCYERPPRPPDWPYSLFAMVHARSEAAARAAVERMRLAAGVDSFVPLATLREFKKSRVVYFASETG